MHESKLRPGRARSITTLAVIGASSFVAFYLLPAASQQLAVTTRVSVNAAGSQANGESTGPALSTEGRYVAFVSWATNLVQGDTNAAADVYVKDRLTGTMVRASVASGGAQADGESAAPAISGDGRYVAFVSEATNLVASDTNNVRDVFLHDLSTGTTTRVSVGSGGEQGNAGSFAPSISADGRYVAFASRGANLVPADSNKASDVFVRDLQSGVTERVSVGPDGVQGEGASEGPSVSGDGRYVAFASTAGNLVPANPSGDTNRVWDVFVRDRATGTTTRVSLASDGSQGNGHSWTPAISAAGRFVAFGSNANNLVAGDTNQRADVLVRDMESGTTTRVSIGPAFVQADGLSGHPSISGDGRFVAFYSYATNLVAADTNSAQDVFLHDRVSGANSRVSVGMFGAQGNAVGLWPSISVDGRFVGFPDAAGNLALGDTNAALDVFVRGPLY